jgi:hypothetical protein
MRRSAVRASRRRSPESWIPDAGGGLRGSERRIVRSSSCPTRTDLFCSDPLWVLAAPDEVFPLSRSLSPTKGGRGVQSVAAFFVCGAGRLCSFRFSSFRWSTLPWSDRQGQWPRIVPADQARRGVRRRRQHRRRALAARVSRDSSRRLFARRILEILYFQPLTCLRCPQGFPPLSIDYGPLSLIRPYTGRPSITISWRWSNLSGQHSRTIAAANCARRSQIWLSSLRQ